MTRLSGIFGRARASASISLLILGSFSGCGFGTGGIAAAISKARGHNTNAPSTAASLQVIDTKTSPARIRVALTDAEADVATVEFFYVPPGAHSAEVALTQLAQNPVTLATSREGVVHELPWSFIGEALLPGNGSFVDGVVLIARVKGGPALTTVTGLGNDAPVVDQVQTPTSEITGVVPIGLRLSDTSGDPVDVVVEFFEESNPGAGWRVARPAGSNGPIGGAAFRGVIAPPPGVDLVFFWDTNSQNGDLRHLERDVRMRFRPTDSATTGLATESGTFRVDNNAAPIIQLGESAFTANPNDGRGIPIPFTVVDEESDPVRVLFQWRRQSQPGFPSLGTTDPNELARLVKDRRFVREKQICRPFPSHAHGYAFVVDATHLRLPELQQGESRLLAGGMELRQLELLRPTPLARLAAAWSQNPLAGPSAAVPLGDGLTALVLDGLGGTSRLLEVDLATGAQRRAIAAGLSGSPSTLALDLDEQGALVATDSGGSWQLFEVNLGSGTPTMLMAAGAGGPVGPLRGILRTGDRAALATAGNALWRLDWSGTGTVVRVCDNLATPWGLVPDPLRPGHVIIAERDASRLVSCDVNARSVEPVPASRAGGPAFMQPTSIATTRTGTGTRLLVLCNAAAPAQRQVVGLNLGSHDHTVFSLGPVPVDSATVATGPDGLLLVALPLLADLAAGGGVEQRREVVSFDSSTALTAVASAFVPPVRPQQRWRIAVGRSIFDAVRGTPGGTPAVFVWDSRDAGFRDRVFVKATPMDTEFGSPDQTSIARPIENVEIMEIASGAQPSSVVAADVDSDGDVDLVCANRGSNNLTVFFQDAPRSFTPRLTLPAGMGPSAVAAADLDGDGHLDIVCANEGSNNLMMFFQDAAGSFTAQILPLAQGSAPTSVVATDLDGNGYLDLVCATRFGNNLTVFFQDALRSFTAQALTLPAGSAPTLVAAADLDGDGHVDLVCANNASNNLTVFFQDAPRSFPRRLVLPTGRRPLSVAIADLDGDGRLDLVCANRDSNDLTVFFQDVPGTFTTALTLPAGTQPTAVVAADLDGDGRLDLVCSNQFSNDLALLLQDAPRTFRAGPPPLVAGSAPGSSPVSLAVADLDGNGDVDLVCANQGGAGLTVFFGDASRTFRPAPLAAGFAPSSVAAADLDGDGDLDLVSANRDSFDLTVSFQEAPRSFMPAPPLTMPIGSGTLSLAAADLDGNGHLDLVCANEDRDNLTLFLQNPPRTFTAQSPLPTGHVPYSVVVADVDGDGHLDLVCANRDSNTLTVFYWDPVQRTFAPAPPITLPTGSFGPVSVVATDLDGDGDVDLACANQGSNNLTVFLQDAPRSFTPRLTLPAGTGPSAVAATDVDSDGHLDLVCANRDSDTLTVFYWDPLRRTFAPTPPIALPPGSRPVSVAGADLDGDGNLDLVCANQGSNNLTVLFQDAPRSFAAQSLALPAGSSAPTSVTAADLDGDGDLDLICANQNTNDLTVFYGRSR